MTGDAASGQQTTLRAGEKELPKNLVHHCAKDDAADWSYVYFGSYPQTEVTGDVLTPAIINAAYDENGDAWVDGTKYQRMNRKFLRISYMRK